MTLGENALFVTHPRSGLITRIDLPNGATHTLVLDANVVRERTERRSTWGVSPAYGNGRLFVPHVLAAPGDPTARTRGYGDTARSVVADVAALDRDAFDASVKPSVVDPLDPEELVALTSRAGRLDDCVLPAASAIHTGSGSLLIGCLGTNELVAVALDAPTPLRAERARIPIGAGVSGIAVGLDGTVIVHEAFDRTLRRLQLRTDASGAVTAHSVGTTALPPADRDTAWERGRALFHRVGDSRIARDGRACASCHPSGADDGLVWSTPDGPRRTLSLRSSAEGHPLSWSGTETELSRRILRTTDRLGASGQLTSGELHDLSTYVRGLRSNAPRAAVGRVARGAARFSEMGCANCHTGSILSDGRRHDVGSATAADTARAFRTSALVDIRERGPYFHDGRYATLRALIFDRDSAMGSRKTATPEELEELLAYVESL
jgi:mono/diheme cytochrome c family protein